MMAIYTIFVITASYHAFNGLSDILDQMGYYVDGKVATYYEKYLHWHHGVGSRLGTFSYLDHLLDKPKKLRTLSWLWKKK